MPALDNHLPPQCRPSFRVLFCEPLCETGDIVPADDSVCAKPYVSLTTDAAARHHERALVVGETGEVVVLATLSAPFAIVRVQTT